jgi:hypothetical protein
MLIQFRENQSHSSNVICRGLTHGYDVKSLSFQKVFPRSDDPQKVETFLEGEYQLSVCAVVSEDADFLAFLQGRATEFLLKIGTNFLKHRN